RAGSPADREKPDHRNRRLLRPRRERPRRRGGERGNEIASPDPHSITSSARPKSVIGNVTPSALAGFMWMANSILVACWTGRSAGFTGIADCCARAASGHAAAPPRRATNCLRLMPNSRLELVNDSISEPAGPAVIHIVAGNR